MKKRFFAEKPVSFEEAFPNIEEIKVEVNQSSLGGDFKRNITLNKENISGFELCSNRGCHNGGYQLGDFISEMDRKKETSKEGMILCRGYEKMGGKNTRSCTNGIRIKAKIKFKK